jgi:DHA1 family bicyclomycin/chloramphenicol resistance-like MFS transporter
MGSIMGVTPVIAPVFGGFLQVAFGWRASFIAMAVGALILFVLAALLVPETIRMRQHDGLSLRTILRSYAIVLRHRTFLIYVGLLALSYSGLFAFISASSFVMQGVYGLNEIAFGLSFASCSISFVAGTLIGTRIVSRRGFDRTIAVGVALLAIGGLGQLAGVIFFPTRLLALVLPEMFYFTGIGLVLPQAMAAAMSPFPDRAGAASSLAGFTQMVFASITGAVVGGFVGGSALPLVVASAASGVCAFVLFHTTKRLRTRPH